MSAMAPMTHATSRPVHTHSPAEPSSANGTKATANGGGYRKIAKPPATSTAGSYNGCPSSNRCAAWT